MDPDVAQQAAQLAANHRLNETISDLPKFYGTAKDTVSAENLIDGIDVSQGFAEIRHFRKCLGNSGNA